MDDLADAIASGLPGEVLQRKETDYEGIPARSVLQWCRLLMPLDLEDGGARALSMPYKQAGKCLSDFCKWDELKDSCPDAKRRYDFTIQIAADAVKEFRYWSEHDAWNGQRLHEKGKGTAAPRGGRPVRRTNGIVTNVAPGLLFPILSAVSVFVENENGVWVIRKPKIFRPEKIISQTCEQFRKMNREVTQMGRSEMAYDNLWVYTETLADTISAVMSENTSKS